MSQIQGRTSAYGCDARSTGDRVDLVPECCEIRGRRNCRRNSLGSVSAKGKRDGACMTEAPICVLVTAVADTPVLDSIPLTAVAIVSAVAFAATAAVLEPLNLGNRKRLRVNTVIGSHRSVHLKNSARARCDSRVVDSVIAVVPQTSSWRRQY